jgi:hypothetical protein
MTVDESEPAPSFGPVIQRQSPGDRFRLDFSTRDGETVRTAGTIRTVEADEAMEIETDDGDRYRVEAREPSRRNSFGLALYRADGGEWERVRLRSFARE